MGFRSRLLASWSASRDWFTQFLPIALMILFTAFSVTGYTVSRGMISVATLETRQEYHERIAYEQCRSENDTRIIIGEVLDEISGGPLRPEETEDQYLDRIATFDEAKSLLTLNECHPPVSQP